MRMISSLATAVVVAALATPAFAGNSAMQEVSTTRGVITPADTGKGQASPSALQDVSTTRRAVETPDDTGTGPANLLVNTTHSNIRHPSKEAAGVAVGDVNGDGPPETLVNTTHSNIRHPSKEAAGDVNGDGRAATGFEKTFLDR